MTKSRIFLFLLLSFIAGVAFGSFLHLPVIVIWVGFAIGAPVAVFGILRKSKNTAVCGFLILAFFTGVFRLEQIERTGPDLSSFYGQAVILWGIITEEPERTQAAQRLRVKIESMGDRVAHTAFYTLATTRRYPKYKIGDELKLEGILEEPQNFADFDYVSYLSRDDIFSVMSFPLIEKVGEGRGSQLRLILSRTKHSFEEKIDNVLPEPHGAFLKGLLLGERESLPPGLVEDFKKTGTTHIVALSGYNITMVGRFFIASLLFLTIPFRLAFWLATAGIILFVILTGASPSVVRAGIMGILVLLAQREGRAYHMTNALALAAAAMVFQNPRILRFDAAFQLSFLATLGLVYLSPHVESRLDRIRDYFRRNLREENEVDPRFLKKFGDENKFFPFKQIFTETLSAQLAVLPLLIYLFGRVSLISPLSNILVLIAVPYAMAAGFVTGISGFLWQPLAELFSWVSWVLLEYQIRIIELLARIPASSVKIGRLALIFLTALYGWGAFRFILKRISSILKFSKPRP